MSGRMSGVQREVAHLYRRVLRAAKVKDAESGSTTTTELVKSEFRHKAASVGRTDFRTIEHLIRVGNKKLKLLTMPGVRAAEGLIVQRR